MSRRRSLLVFAGMLCACGSGSGTPAPAQSALGPDEIPLVVEKSCPGGPGCEDTGDGVLYAGVSKREITPPVEPFQDVNGNGHWDDGEPFEDRNGNGKFDAFWLAGYDSGRQAYGVHDPTWVRCLALKQNQTTLVECVVDVVGLFIDEMDQIRADLDPSLGVDELMMSATHVHETQDSCGQWGPDDTTSGYNDAYMSLLRHQTVAAVADAVHALAPAKMSIASIAVEDPGHDMTPYVSDTRDPVVIDNRLHLLQFDAASGDKPIATVVNWSSHPESEGSHNHYVSSDFVHWLRESVEKGTGSEVLYISGSVGGQVGPGRVQPFLPDGTQIPRGERSFRFAEAWGEEIARFALKAFAARVPVPSPRLAFRTTRFYAHVENTAYHAAGALHLFHRAFYGYDPKKPLSGDNTPVVNTAAAYVTLGPASIITTPGELLPELLVGGYDGSRAGTWTPFIDMTKPNPPDVSKAPKPPYLFDLMDGDPDNRMNWGLTMDFLGYIVPRYNFVLDTDAPYLQDAPGDHYEETNSVGPRAEPEPVGTMRQLVTYGRK